MHGFRLGFLLMSLALLVALLAPHDWLRIGVQEPFDKVLHIGAFFIVGLCGALGWPHRRMQFLLLLPLAGVASEAAQTLTPSREFSWLDATMNGLGVGVAVALSVVVARRMQPRAQRHCKADRRS